MKNHFGTNALIAALVLALSTMAVAQEKLAGAPSEGIKVHGHWTIEIRNPDGSLASHSEFENSLADSGKWHLAGILGKFYTVDAWEIVLVDGSSSSSGLTTRMGRVSQAPAQSPTLARKLLSAKSRP